MPPMGTARVCGRRCRNIDETPKQQEMDARKEPNAHGFVGATYGYSENVWAQVGANAMSASHNYKYDACPSYSPCSTTSPHTQTVALIPTCNVLVLSGWVLCDLMV